MLQKCNTEYSEYYFPISFKAIIEKLPWSNLHRGKRLNGLMWCVVKGWWK